MENTNSSIFIPSYIQNFSFVWLKMHKKFAICCFYRKLCLVGFSVYNKVIYQVDVTTNGEIYRSLYVIFFVNIYSVCSTAYGTKYIGL